VELTRVVQIDGVGPVCLERSRRAKRLSISIRPFRGIRVAVPLLSSFPKAEAFTLSKKKWIIKNIDKIRLYENTLREQAAASRDVDKKQATIFLNRKLRELAVKHGFTYNKVTIRNQKTRWGSCSPDNNISLNMQLARLPQELVDYVILHELVHTKIKNHGQDFWKEMDRLTGNSRQLRAKMRSYRPISSASLKEF